MSKSKNKSWWNANKTGDIELIILLIFYVLTVIGSIWGGIVQFFMNWDTALTMSDKFHIWFHAPFSAGYLMVIGFVGIIIMSIISKR